MDKNATIAILADDRFGDTYVYTYQEYSDGKQYSDVRECFPLDIDPEWTDEQLKIDVAKSIELYDLSDEDGKSEFLTAHTVKNVSANFSNIRAIIEIYCSDVEIEDNKPIVSAKVQLKNQRQQFNTRLPRYTITQIDRLANERGMTKTQILILAIAQMSQSST